MALQVTSTILEQSLQIDGRVCVRERHVTDVGDIDERTYIAEEGADIQEMLVENADQFMRRLGGG